MQGNSREDLKGSVLDETRVNNMCCSQITIRVVCSASGRAGTLETPFSHHFLSPDPPHFRNA